MAASGGAVEPVWLRAERPGRERTAACRQEIVDAALSIADAQGYEAVSMRRVAARLGMPTMSLYGRVGSKDDLLDLMFDAVLGEQLLGDVPADWRVALTAIAHRARASFLRHPWILHTGPRLPFGPNGLRHLEESLVATTGLGADLPTRRAVIAAVDEHVMGHVLRELSWSGRGDGCPTDRWRQALADRLGSIPDAEALPELVKAASAPPCPAGPAGRFERSLAWLLDGIAAECLPRAAAR